jgi:hypothetical protein
VRLQHDRVIGIGRDDIPAGAVVRRDPLEHLLDRLLHGEWVELDAKERNAGVHGKIREW